jgi:hypothetical protein
MIKRYEIRPRRKRTASGQEPAPEPSEPRAGAAVAGPLTPAGVFDDK